MITKKVFDKFPDGAVFMQGICLDSPDHVHLNRTEELRKWVAKKGAADDWVIYIGRYEWDFGMIVNVGDKPFDERNIRILVNCSDEVFQLYRH